MRSKSEVRRETFSLANTRRDDKCARGDGFIFTKFYFIEREAANSLIVSAAAKELKMLLLPREEKKWSEKEWARERKSEFHIFIWGVFFFLAKCHVYENGTRIFLQHLKYYKTIVFLTFYIKHIIFFRVFAWDLDKILFAALRANPYFNHSQKSIWSHLLIWTTCQPSLLMERPTELHNMRVQSTLAPKTGLMCFSRLT